MKLDRKQAADVVAVLKARVGYGQSILASECHQRYMEYEGDKTESVNALLAKGDKYLTSIVIELTVEKLT